MKNIVIFFLLALSCRNIIFAQKAAGITASGALRQKINVKQFEGRQIMLKAFVRVRAAGGNAATALYMKVQKQNGQTGGVFFSVPINQSKGWTSCSVSGLLDVDADSLNLGCIFNGRGPFYYDNFILCCGTENITLADSSFEAPGDFDEQKKWTVPILPTGFTVNKKSGTNRFLIVDGTGGQDADMMGDNDKAGLFATINGIRIYYETYGEGEPLLLLHGNQQSIGVFKDQISEFSKHYKVIAVDTRGQGKSEAGEKAYSYDLFANDMIALLEQLKIEKTNIVGWSDGGNTGLIMAMQHPSKIKKLVTMGACIFINNTVVDKKVFKGVNKIIENLGKDSAQSNKNSILLYKLLLTEPNHRFEELKKITCPVLVMAGKKDIIKAGHTKGIAQNILRGRLYISSKYTHYFPVENPVEFNEIVLNFFNE